MDDRVVLDKGGTRKLPQWMFATSAADQVKEKAKTDKVDNNNTTEEEVVTQRQKNRRIKDKKETFTEESSTQLPICQTTKRSRRKLNLPNDDCNDQSTLMGSECDSKQVSGDGEVPMLRRQKQKTKNSKTERVAEMEESTTTASDRCGLRKRKCSRLKENSSEAGPNLRRQKQKTKNSWNENCADVEESIPNTDDEDLTVEDLMHMAEEYAGDADEDLTVEDLMSIAKEYVNENEQATSGKGKSGPTEDAISMSIGSLSEVDNQSLRRETNFDCISIQERTIEDASPKLNMSENPTQDMLDLFLGPLLKKTHEEKRVELVREEMSLAHDLNKKTRSNPSEVQPLMVKKKSSLKDKNFFSFLQMQV
ncbi:uncharacterized protein LOC107015942 isoform X1 [Solanum pennellii]|uniref:Uncharacterized protein LOC107015942 isoform X1 n=1 Tax=Solanum pennellii TaxID=28526 RepID=A0ABM1GJE8_SOLPN|nr:uncharacterized protein LOC107015942 isoform X1 [Solanum pennellii]